MSSISRRAVEMPASPIRRLAPYADSAKERGIHIYHLNIGQPDIPTPKEVFEAISSHSETVLSYGPSLGLQELRHAVCEYLRDFGITVELQDVMITTGGSEAILFAMLAVTDHGDEILVPEPFYTNYNGYAAMAGVKLVSLLTYAEEGFRPPSTESILEKISPRTKAILLCTPNNPTGVIFTREELTRIAQIATEHDLFILSDEVYREFTFDGKVHTSILQLKGIEERSIMLDSISKRFSACGARVGYLVSRNRDVMDAALRFGQARLCPPTLEQIGAIAAFRCFHKYIPSLVREYETRRNAVYQEILKIPGVVCRKPEGAFYTVVKFPISDSEDFAKFMLTDFSQDGKTTMIAPASGFYASPQQGMDEARVAYVLDKDSLRDAMRILRKGLDTYRSRTTS
ncbi:aspartate aminotransferase [candidate division TA06 bacterium DG_26]|uniref:Aminotransferase n=1 Tax=candidate division TA06 bacterium DG_26 TaxID=1703771 RepID=A0A0S7WLW8_UNCT6|nr:MAG: aspartate aminotransferase [candidate division TA06 bacterium DG_26]